MASFGEAITATMIAGLDPEAGMRREYMRTIIDQTAANAALTKADIVDSIETKLAAALARDADAAVIACYRKLLASVAG